MRGWGDRVRSYDQVCLHFNRTFRNGEGLNPVSKSTIDRTVRRFLNHGSIKDLQRTGRPKSAGSEEMQMDIAQAFVENPHLSAYEELLRNQIVPRIREITGNNFQNIWFQQDGAAAQYGREVRAYLDTQFPHRWIGRRGEIEWTTRSPDLTPLDYFHWRYLKSKVYATQPKS